MCRLAWPLSVRGAGNGTVAAGLVDPPSDHISAWHGMNGITADSRAGVQTRPELFVAYAESDTEWVHGFLLPEARPGSAIGPDAAGLQARRRAGPGARASGGDGAVHGPGLVARFRDEPMVGLCRAAGHARHLKAEFRPAGPGAPGGVRSSRSTWTSGYGWTARCGRDGRPRWPACGSCSSVARRPRNGCPARTPGCSPSAPRTPACSSAGTGRATTSAAGSGSRISCWSWAPRAPGNPRWCRRACCPG